ncbi:MAG: hypothetical protein M3Y87_24825 [Myxococcota bacterium]|nr:hypothetical protein [Myxococcota bacterium]
MEEDPARLERGRRLLIACAISYAIVSLGMNLSASSATDDPARFVRGLVRLAIGLAMFWAAGRGSTAVAGLLIALLGVAGIAGVVMAFTIAAQSIDTIVLALMFALAFGGLSLRMAMSRELWDYVRSSRRARAGAGETTPRA